MKDFKYTKHGDSSESGKSVETTKYMQKFKGRRRVNISRLIYAFILLAISAVILIYIANKLLYVNGKGVVISDKYIVRLNHDIAVKDYWVNIGERIMKGDTLLSYQTGEQVKEQKSFRKDKIARINSYHKIKNDLEKDINLKRIKKRHYLRLKTNKIMLVNRLKKEVYLDVSKRQRLEKSQQEYIDLDAYIKFLSEEIAYLDGYLKNHKSTYLFASNNTSSSLSNLSDIKYLISPVAGKLLSRGRIPSIIDKNDEILEINKDEGVVIIANISQSSLNHVSIGIELSIKFSDGTKSRGILKEIIEPHLVDEIINTKQLDEMTKIQFKIIPVDGEEIIWSSRIGFTVKISKSIIF